MTDRELLEMAAKAVGQPIEFTDDVPVAFIEDGQVVPAWNPLTDDGDALRLAVKLRMDIAHFAESVRADATGYDDCHESNGDDSCAATRRAIVRAASHIGQALSRDGGKT